MQYRIKNYGLSCEIFMGDKMLSQDTSGFSKLIDNFIDSQKINMIINFENTKYIETTGLGLLLFALQKTNDANKHLSLRNPSGKVMEALNILNFNVLFNVELV